MRINRSAHLRFFTTLNNDVLRDNRLSFCARGVLGHLLSLADGQRGDIRTLTERTPEGRERVASALRELERFGYLKRVRKRTPEGHLYTEVDVFETPNEPSSQTTPNPVNPGSGEPTPASGGDQPVKKPDEEPTRPQPSADDDHGREGADDEETAASAQVLARVARAEPKLALGIGEVLCLASLVTEWRRRGASDLHVINSLTAGLPKRGVYHPAKFLETRLRNKMPAEPSAAPARLECVECQGPVVVAGLCRACCEQARSGAGPKASADVVQACARGVALARAALRGAPVGIPATGLA